MRNQSLFEALIKAFCPSIFGQELVKAGLLLCLVGNNTD
jgi:DNA replicative helicase MCM subunit Mcm2 (Cdc46/Mcm family)